MAAAVFLAGAFGFAQAQSPLERAVALVRERHYGEARQLLEGVAEPAAVSQRIAYHRLRAAIASGLSDTVGAATEMQAALESAPADSSLLLGAAVAELQAGQLDIALRHVSSAGESGVASAIAGGIQEK